jgi:hypothetical protein
MGICLLSVMSLFENPHAGNCPCVGVPWALANAYQDSRIPASNTTEAARFWGDCKPVPQLRSITRSALRLRIPSLGLVASPTRDCHS